MDVSNYRPISLLPISSEFLDSQVCHIIDEHIADSSVKNRNQWGFCERPIRRKHAHIHV